MGGRGTGSGLKKESMFKPISLSGKTGTDKQKKYAQDLLDSMRRNTALANGTAGRSTVHTGNRKRYPEPFRSALQRLCWCKRKSVQSGLSDAAVLLRHQRGNRRRKLQHGSSDQHPPEYRKQRIPRCDRGAECRDLAYH